jgi:hypothetical protein
MPYGSDNNQSDHGVFMTKKSMSQKVGLQTLGLAAGLVFAFQASADPSISSVSGSLEKGQTLVIKGSDFTDKANARPYFIWEASHGKQPRSVGRHKEWDKNFRGEASTEIVSPGSRKSYKFDHGKSTGAALAGVKFDSDELYVYRRTYEDFSTGEDYAVRTRVENIEGVLKEGQLVRGLVSGATGVILDNDKGKNRSAVFYKKDVWTIYGNNSVDFLYGENKETDTATLVNTEGTSQYPTGTYRTFNFKTMRLWNSDSRHNAYIGTGRGQSYDVMPEHTDGKLHYKNMQTALEQRPREWKSEELYYRASSLNSKDGMIDFRFNNQRYYTHGFRTRTSERPGQYNLIYQSQVSNGAQPDSEIFYDYVYIDDTFHQVAICSESTWKACDEKALQIPFSWSNDKISVEFNSRHLKQGEEMYLYVMDGNREVNDRGFLLCSDCPSTPQNFALD